MNHSFFYQNHYVNAKNLLWDSPAAMRNSFASDGLSFFHPSTQLLTSLCHNIAQRNCPRLIIPGWQCISAFSGAGFSLRFLTPQSKLYSDQGRGKAVWLSTNRSHRFTSDLGLWFGLLEYILATLARAEKITFGPIFPHYQRMRPPILRIPKCITRESVACTTHDVNHIFLALVGEMQRGKQGLQCTHYCGVSPLSHQKRKL